MKPRAWRRRSATRQRVAPRTGARIETLPCLLLLACCRHVAPRTGARIETAGLADKLAFACVSPPARGRGLKLPYRR